jgi:prophage regulatory protein
MEDDNNPSGDDRPSPDRYLRQPEVLERVGVSWMTLLRWERLGRFPKRCKIGPRVVAWRESDIDKWFANTSAATGETGAG